MQAVLRGRRCVLLRVRQHVAVQAVLAGLELEAAAGEQPGRGGVGRIDPGDQPDFNDPRMFEAQAFPRRSVAQLARHVQGGVLA